MRIRRCRRSCRFQCTFCSVPGTRSALYANTALIPVFCVYVFLLGTLLCRNKKAAIVAVVVTCCFPLTYGLWRVAMAEFGLAVAVVGSQYHLFRSAEAESRNLTHAVLAGAFIGWGLLWKASFPVFVVGPLCYLCVRNLGVLRTTPRPSARLVLPLVAGVALIVAGPFYFLQIRTLWGFIVYNSSPSPALEQFALGPVFSPVTVLKYWAELVNSGISAYCFIGFVCLSLLQLLRRRWPVPQRETWFIGSCTIVTSDLLQLSGT